MPKLLFIGFPSLKFNKNDPYEDLKLLESFAFSHYLLVSESLKAYLSGIRLNKRRIIVLLQQLCLWIFISKSILMYFHNSKTFIKMAGDFTYLYPRSDILNLVIINILLCYALVGKNWQLFQNSFLWKKFSIIKNLEINVLIHEKRNECEYITIADQIMNSDEYQLNNKYLRKFYLRSRLSIRLFIITWRIVLFLVLITVPIFTAIAYMDSEMDFSIIVMSIWLIIIIITSHSAVTTGVTICLYAHLISVYIQYRFQQIQDYIEVNLQRGKYIK